MTQRPIDIQKTDLHTIWHPFTLSKEQSIPIVKGNGALLYDENDNVYIDAISSWWVNLHGHSHPYIAQKVKEQFDALDHVIFAGFTHPPAVQLARRILKLLPGKPSRLYFSDNGSTAVEVAIKLAVHYHHIKGSPAPKIIAFKHSYHGDTFGAMSVSERDVFTLPFQSMLFDVEYIDPPFPGKKQDSLDQLRSLLEKKKVAAFIFEPLVQGTSGMLMYEPSGLDPLVELCKEHGTLTIADEVMTGFGRTGKMFATDHLNNSPDLICLSKGLTGGTLPMGITSCTEKVFKTFEPGNKHKTFFHGHSFTGNPLACSASLASLDLLQEENTQKSIKNITRKHREFDQSIQSHPMVQTTRQRGTIFALEVKNPRGTSYFSHLRETLYRSFLERGVLLRPLGNTVYILPPYCITGDQLDKVYKTVKEVLDILKI